VLTVHLRNGFFNTSQGYEFNLTLAAALFALTGVGAGGWSLDNALGIDMTGAAWALGALGVGIFGGLAAVIAGRLASREHGHPSTA
jgi:putative oxidoreductase